jgi:hypothetical protein
MPATLERVIWTAGERRNLRWLVDAYLTIQRARIQTSNREGAVQRGTDLHPVPPVLADSFLALEAQEERIALAFGKALEGHPAWPWLRRVRGVSSVLGAQLLGLLDKIEYARCPEHGNARVPRGADASCETCWVPTGRVGIACFDTVSKLWAFSGYGVVNGQRQRPEEGKIRPYSVTVKTVLYKIATSMVRAGAGPYEEIYRRARQRYEASRAPACEKHKKPSHSCPDCWPPSRKHATALRIMIKLFLAHLWETWRGAEGLPLRRSYVHEKLGHPTVTNPWDFVK